MLFGLLINVDFLNSVPYNGGGHHIECYLIPTKIVV